MSHKLLDPSALSSAQLSKLLKLKVGKTPLAGERTQGDYSVLREAILYGNQELGYLVVIEDYFERFKGGVDDYTAEVVRLGLFTTLAEAKQAAQAWPPAS
jgi:hypothetical protein